MPALIGLLYSPWTEKARFALDARRVAYRFESYQPIVGEPALRLELRSATGPVSVPVLRTDEGRLIRDSTAIARWADGRGEGPRLFPADHDRDVDRFVALSERALDAGRALALGRMLDDPEALAEMVPRALARSLGRHAAALGAVGIRRTLRKYGATTRDARAHRSALETALGDLRESLGRAAEPASEHEAKTLLDRFSFADVAAAQALAFVEPPSVLVLGTASRRCFRDEELAARHADLVAWRDALYAEHRGDAGPTRRRVA